jgi:hypothetical protein
MRFQVVKREGSGFSVEDKRTTRFVSAQDVDVENSNNCDAKWCWLELFSSHIPFLVPTDGWMTGEDPKTRVFTSFPKYEQEIGTDKFFVWIITPIG